jgi:hypothetical protein
VLVAGIPLNEYVGIVTAFYSERNVITPQELIDSQQEPSV